MMKRFFLFSTIGLLAGASMLGLTQTPASADGLSIYFGTPPIYVPYNDYRYRRDRYYHDGYDRGHRDHYRSYGYDRGYGGYRHEDRGYHHGDHGRHH